MSNSLAPRLLAALVALGALGSVADAGQFKAAKIQSAGASISCSIPNAVVCSISSNKGIRSVKIRANGPNGPFNLVNKSYPGCPKSVKVSWDSAYHSSSKQVVECRSAKLKLGGR
ncbi:hypothetical protein [Jiella marina]|uniref:hypothetical protein n=1 Tax=Jiella sp. LLJ827 TaxID=2917712 RepID=UPI002101C542|nr:hypothetical protein [Jiella sp. LLJ827]MCQ0990245.1 hypothetical protein [Jiella sp. LLJ827]